MNKGWFKLTEAQVVSDFDLDILKIKNTERSFYSNDRYQPDWLMDGQWPLVGLVSAPTNTDSVTLIATTKDVESLDMLEESFDLFNSAGHISLDYDLTVDFTRMLESYVKTVDLSPNPPPKKRAFIPIDLQEIEDYRLRHLALASRSYIEIYRLDATQKDELSFIEFSKDKSRYIPRMTFSLSSFPKSKLEDESFWAYHDSSPTITVNSIELLEIARLIKIFANKYLDV